mgnify:CR=1 FL=1
MKSLIVKILLAVVFISMVVFLTGCTLKIETTDNSVSASVDGETTEKVDNIIDWIKDRISRIFVTEENAKTQSVKGGESQII